MSTALLHSPADMIAQLLVDLGLGTSPTADPLGAWPVYVDQEPATPDNCITVYDTSPQSDGRSMIDGETFQHFGFQVRVRGITHKIGYAKAEAIRVMLNENSYDKTVHLDLSHYLIHCINGTTLLRLGKNTPSDKRSLYTINAKLCLGDKLP